MLRKIFSIFAINFALSTTAVVAQGTGEPVQPQNEAGTYTLRVKAQTVLLDVVVTDRQGKVVSGLKQDDFSVFEDDQAQPIRSFESSTTQLPAANLSVNSTRELDQKAPNAPVNIIVLDEINTQFEDMAFARYSLKKFLASQGSTLTPTMLVAVNLKHFEVLHDYTTSRSEILEALERHLIAFPWHLRTGGYQSQQINAAFTSLIEIVQATSGHPGHKTVTWVGRGFPSVDPTGMAAPQAANLRAVIARCTNALMAGRVVLYTVDPSGVSVAPAIDAETGIISENPLDGSVNLEALAKATGGGAFKGRNDVDRMIAASAIEGSSFYMLAYTPGTRTDLERSFRNIRIVMRDPNMHAATRLGFFDQSSVPEESARKADGKFSDQLTFDLTVASTGLLVYDGVPMTVVHQDTDPDRFIVRVETKSLPWKIQPGGLATTDLAIVIGSYDRKGKLLQREAHVSAFTLPVTEGRELPDKPMLDILQKMSIGPAVARVRFAVRVNATGKIGTQNVFLVDPKSLEDPETGMKRKK